MNTEVIAYCVVFGIFAVLAIIAFCLSMTKWVIKRDLRDLFQIIGIVFIFFAVVILVLALEPKGCPNCDFKVGDSAYCESCGYNLKPQICCEGCGTKYSVENQPNYCRNCGTAIKSKE